MLEYLKTGCTFDLAKLLSLKHLLVLQHSEQAYHIPPTLCRPPSNIKVANKMSF